VSGNITPDIPISGNSGAFSAALNNHLHQPLQYFNYSYLPLSTRTHQIVFRDSSLLKQPPPPLSFPLTIPLEQKTLDTSGMTPKAKSSLAERIVISKPSNTKPASNTARKNKKHQRDPGQKKKQEHTIKKIKLANTVGGKKDDYVYGYIVAEKRMAVIVENGITYIYRIPQSFIDKYL
jgi:hypothetical protein